MTNDKDFENFGFETETDNIAYYSANFVNMIDNVEILKRIREKYPKITDSKETDKESRKEFIEMLKDKEFIYGLMEQFDLEFFDLFNFFSKFYSYLFSTNTFLKTVKRTVAEVGYITFDE